MNSPLKMHRPTAIIAALLMILSGGMYVGSLITDFTQTYVYLTVGVIASNLVLPVLFVVLLFRGRKDAFAGVVFLVAAAVSVLNAWVSLFGLLANIALNMHELDHYSTTNIIGALMTTVFMVLLGVECLSRGRISGTGARVVLWVLPIVILGCKVWQMVPLYVQDGIETGEIILSISVAILPERLSQILMGVSLSIPQKKEV